MKITAPMDYGLDKYIRITYRHWWDIPIATLLHKLKLKKSPHIYTVCYVTGGKLRIKNVTSDEFSTYPVSSLIILNVPRGYHLEWSNNE